jgi:hypothetical protein
MRTLRTLAVSSLSAVALVGAAASPSAADSPNWQRTLDDMALAPFQIAVNHQWVYVADGFYGTVTRHKGGTSQVVAQAAGEVAAVDLSPDGKWMAYTVADETGTALHIEGPGSEVVADLLGHELGSNPDGGVEYGFVAGTPSECLDQFEMNLGFPAVYTGIEDSHPYGVAWLGDGSWAVADAGGNDILRVGADGAVSTLAVLPPQVHELTADQAAGFGIPACAGQDYRFEPVPTDVDAQGGMLYVSTLPGGDEQGLLGNRGSVYAVSPGTGAATQLATGFGGATNVAVAPNGTMYVSEFFGGGVTEVKPNGARRLAAALVTPIGLDVQGAYLYVGTLAQIDEDFNPVSFGSVLRIKR